MPVSPNPTLDNIRQALGRGPDQPRPERPVLPAPPNLALPTLVPRTTGSRETEIERLFAEIQALSGVARHVAPAELGAALSELVGAHHIQRAVMWATPGLAELRIAERLAALGVQQVPADAGKHALAQCDLGITEADFALPETGTLGLFSSPEKPRTISLLPAIHLAIVRPSALRADLHQVFSEARRSHYLVLVTGPSRTADIELTVTLGVHGPKALVMWMLPE